MEITPKGFEKMSASLTPADLDTPVDEYVVKTEEPSSESVPEPEVEEPVEPEPEEPEEDRVPKSRLLTVLERAKKAEEDKASLEARIAALEETRVSAPKEELELPPEWVAMYGDSEESKKFYMGHMQNLAQIEEKAAERAFERINSKAKEAEQIETEIASRLSSEFETLTDVEGKSFTDDDQARILEIVEELSPKDKDGKILKDYMVPVSTAHKYWKLEQEAALVSKKKARSQAVSLTSAKTEGEPSGNSASEFIPGRQRQWLDKLPK